MKRLFPLCLLLIIVVAWSISFAGAINKLSSADSPSQFTKEKKQKVVEGQSAAADEMTPEKAARIAEATGERLPDPAEAVKSDGTPGIGIAGDRYPSIAVESRPQVRTDSSRPVSIAESEDAMQNNAEFRMKELKADGVIDEAERAEYEQLLSETPVIELPVPLSIVYESEPNNDCASADSIACGDTVWCATQTTGTDDHDWFVFTLDNTYPSWQVMIETHPTITCPPGSYDTYLELWTGDCLTMLTYNDDGGVDWFSLINTTLLPGTYAVHEDNTHYNSDGSYHLSLICAEDTCYGDQPPNNYCASVTPVVLTAGVPHTFTGNNECAVNECSFFPGGHVWIAFTSTVPGDISLEYCNSTGFWGNAWLNLTDCPCSGFSTAADFNFTCADGNAQMHWSSFPPGTYYYPVMLDPPFGSVGNYSVTVRVDSLPPFWSCVNDPPSYMPPDGKLPGGVGDIEPNDRCTEAVIAQCEYAYCGAIANENDADWYYVDIPADTTYGLHIRVFGDDTHNQYAYGQGLDPRVELYGPDCTTLIAMNEDYFGTFPDAEVCDSQINPGWPNCFAANTRVYIKISTFSSAPGPYLLIINCEPCYLPTEFGSWECPPTNTLLNQPPYTPSSELWTATTSELDAHGSNYKLFESFEDAGEITDIHFWGWKAVLNEQTYQWENCSEEPMTFLIEFWLDDGAGMPNVAIGPVYSYNIPIAGLYMDSLYWGYINAYEWSGVLPVPCTLSSGFVSIQGQLDPDCWFMWLSSPVGDGHSCFMKNGRLIDFEYDVSLCLTGTSMDVYGACCDDATGTCTGNVEQQQCPPPLRFRPNALCADLDPPCGEIPGACCDPLTGNCIVVLEDICMSLGWNYQSDWTHCDPNPCPPPPPANDSCQNAITVTVPSDTPGYTISATPDTLTCEVNHFANGVWYKVIGTGNTITASLCDAATDYDTKIQVWCNTCTSPVCIGGNDDDLNCVHTPAQSAFSWCSEFGTEYLILVGGFWDNSGNFVLHVYDDGIPCSDSPNCAPPIGRCCYNDDLDCADVSLEDCIALGGYWIDLLNCRDYPCASCPGGQDKIIVDLTTDYWPDEITWEIYERNVGLIASGGPYSSPNTNFVYEICVDQGGCYDWYIYDPYGDGGAAYDLYYDGVLVHSSSGFYGFGETVYDVGNSGCGEPTGACCIGSECVATNYQSECVTLGGMWYIGEDCAAFDCPPFGCNSSSLFSQNPTSPEGRWAFGNSEPFMDSGPGYLIFEDFFGLTGDVCDIHFWGAQLYSWPEWHDCGEDPVPFLFTFYADNGGVPDTANPLCVFVDTISGIGAGQIYDVVEAKYYETVIDPCCTITDGWISIAGGGDPACWFMWLSAGEAGSGFSYQMWMDSGTLSANDYDLSLCLTPAGGDCCEYIDGDVNGSTSYNGLDITYGVAFFKGGPAPMCPGCEVNGCGSWNYCGDVNASCSYNGLDITYGVAYFKGGAAPMPCVDCPPCAGISGDLKVPETPQVIKTKTIFQQKPISK